MFVQVQSAQLTCNAKQSITGQLLSTDVMTNALHLETGEHAHLHGVSALHAVSVQNTGSQLHDHVVSGASLVLPSFNVQCCTKCRWGNSQ